MAVWAASYGGTGSASGFWISSISRKCPRCTASGRCSDALRHAFSIWISVSTRGNLAVDVGVYLGVEAGCVKTLAPILNVMKEGSVEPTAARAGNAGTGDEVERVAAGESKMAVAGELGISRQTLYRYAAGAGK